MANAPQGLVEFPGIEQPLRAQYTLSHGITPGVCTLDLVPQADFVGEGGLLRFTFGDVELDFPDCKVDLASLRYNQSGFLVSLSILDRRWKWAFGEISGSYNTRRDDGRPLPERVQEAQDLCGLCLDALGEEGYDVSLVPLGVFPVVDWEYDNPAQALAALADEAGCRVVLRLDNTVAIIPAGTGFDLPDNPLIEADSLTINPPERPDALAYVCGRTRYQMEIGLRAVGLDVDGLIKLIDDLSYKPACGWEKTDPRNFSAVGAAIDASTADGRRQQEFLRTLARDTVWRWYQIDIGLPDLDGLSPGDLTVLVVPTIDDAVTQLKQILLLDEQVVLITDVDGFQRPKPAEVIGIFADLRLATNDTAPRTRYWRGFSIDAERGLVQFNDPVYATSDTSGGDDGPTAVGDVHKPELSLRTAFCVRDPDTWAWRHYVRRLDFGTDYGTGDKLYKHDESFLAVLQTVADDGTPTGTADNKDDLNIEADAYLAAAQVELQLKLPQDRAYSGLLPISPDGAIQQVSWEVAPDKTCSTRASRNSEFSPNVPLYKTRRFFEQLRNQKTTQLAGKVNALAREISFRPPRPG